MINKYISALCDILHISKPEISYNTKNFKSKTMMAQVDFSGTLYLCKKSKPNPDYMFAIAHELRHLWQIKTDKKLYFSDYKTVDILGVEKYNNQLAEIDAHAFASIIMIDFFHLKPVYNGLSAQNIALVKDRMKEIIPLLNE